MLILVGAGVIIFEATKRLADGAGCRFDRERRTGHHIDPAPLTSQGHPDIVDVTRGEGPQVEPGGHAGSTGP